MAGDFSLPSSFSIGKHFREFIKQQVKEGRYQTASEVMRAGLRLLEQEEHRWKTRHLNPEIKADKDNPGLNDSPPP